ncbi:AtpZ/AtpI family protein [Rickettsiales endosymbiont of Peranema trichophorum]|uniref:AtpZ/AtpI family protein n=1 Tax=Rickettsiales endosymbiont of Peranema trichophorum TaxID=2486577 RepID=UPI0010233927|nr:AtpZ/AtpI family protein [Rickettsiales endosymbiont of Peranema trichophorum]RZI47522.1 AtpZ/AtpI family protein [Rickettsiales endosymbiont of Peranema trichophorum]
MTRDHKEWNDMDVTGTGSPRTSLSGNFDGSDTTLSILQNKIQKLKPCQNAHQQRCSSSVHSRFLIDLISGMAIGGAVGYCLDLYMTTLPLFLFICIVLGTVGGIRNFSRVLMASYTSTSNNSGNI